MSSRHLCSKHKTRLQEAVKALRHTLARMDYWIEHLLRRGA